MRRRRLVLILMALLLVLLATAGFSLLRNRGNRPPFKTAVLERGDIDRLVTATGVVNPVVSVKVGTQVSGTIKELYADYNSRVQKGQVIALLDQDTFEAQVNKARAELETAQRNLEKGRAELDSTRINLENALARLAQDKAGVARAEAALLSSQADLERAKVLAQDAKVKLDRMVRLVKEGIVALSEGDTAQASYDAALAQLRAAEGQVRAAEAQVEASKAQVNAAESQVESARASVRGAEINLKYLQSKVEEQEASLKLALVNLERTVIRAPIDGIVVSRDVDVGQTVAASLQSPTLYAIAGDLTKMQVNASIDEADIGNIRVGQMAIFTVDAYPEETFSGKVSEIRLHPIIAQNVVTYDTVIMVDNPTLSLRPGMTANVSILVERREGVLKLPNAALRFNPTRDALDKEGGWLSRLKGWIRGDKNGAMGDRRPGRMGRGGDKAHRVWVLGDDGRPKPVLVRLGISDGSFTEVVAGNLREGQRVIVGVVPRGPRPDEMPPTPFAPHRRLFGPPRR